MTELTGRLATGPEVSSSGPVAPADSRRTADSSGTAGPRGAARSWRGAARRALPWLTSIVLLSVWELLARGGVFPVEIPAISKIAEAFVRLAPTEEFQKGLQDTINQFAVALSIGGAIGIALGILLGAIAPLYRLLHYVLDFLRFIPAIVYLPILILVMGARPQVGYTLGAIGAIWPLLFQTYYGVRGVDPVLIDSGRAFGLRYHQRLFQITLPAVSPFVATGLRIAASHVLVVVVAVEIVSAVKGIGSDIAQYAANAVYPPMYALVGVTGLFGVLINVVLQWIERRLLHWHSAYRETES